MIKINIRITLLICLLFSSFSCPLYAINGFYDLTWKIPFRDGFLDETSRSAQWWGLCGMFIITGYAAYKSYKEIAAYIRLKQSASEKRLMTAKDKTVLNILLGCACRDLAMIRTGTSHNLQVSKVNLDKMSPLYAAEAQLMRSEFMCIAALCQQDSAARELLEAFYQKWHDAVQKACAPVQPLAVQQNIL